MKELQTVALGLIVVFVDVGDPDWIADPLGWLLVLVGIAALKGQVPDYGYLQLTAWVCLGLSIVIWPPDSVPTLDSTFDWVFSLPTLAFCYLLADSLYDVTVPNLAQWLRLICWSYALVAFLPLLPLLADWDWLETPATVLAIAVDVVLVIALFSAAGDDAVREDDGEHKASGSERKSTEKKTTEKRSAARTGGTRPASTKSSASSRGKSGSSSSDKPGRTARKH